MSERPLVLSYAARSDVGMVRAKNDDSAYVGKHLAVVADGMGGHAGGDVASASTVLDLIHLDRDGYQGDASEHLADEIQTANSLLSQLVHINPKLAGMGTTVTAMLLSGDILEMAHIGDSRAYRLKDGVFEQISVDHTFVQRMIDEGRLRPEEAETHPHKNVLMRVLGDVDASPELDLMSFEAQEGERWLLCSDGLNFVRHNLVEEVVRTTTSLASCADTLVELTLAAGAPDNVTVVVFDVVREGSESIHTASLATVPAAQELPAAGSNDDDVDAAADGATADALDGEAPESDNDGPSRSGDLGAHITAAVIRQELSERPHELVGAAVTAFAEGKIPVIEGHSAARRAATVLTHKVAPGIQSTDVEEETEESIPPRNLKKLAAVIGAIVAVLLALGLWAGYAWTQTLYYVGASNGKVVIFNGVSQSLGPIQLSHVYRETGIDVVSLPDYSRQRLAQTLPARNLDDAAQIISDLQLGAGSSTPPCPSPTAAPTATPGASPAAETTPAPAASSAAPLAVSTPTCTGGPQ
ncbi:PP2C family protein-serine/threonine phosphatase [Arthrobacter sp. 35W]|uniref:PP2C family protein-serine/threonine phosphatase n=1 Tax=Arthrobacter sp. 35W TaxID=1132441 RepID=UPI0003FE78A0|nr:protein phosphatase 2C domain-containing protein [Arthrobacter sp. 35W]